MAPILEGTADVVYGSRFAGGESHPVPYFWHSVANRFLTLLSNMFTDLNLTDMETGYKVFRREIIQSVKLTEDRFGFEPEVTARMVALKCWVCEVGISVFVWWTHLPRLTTSDHTSPEPMCLTSKGVGPECADVQRKRDVEKARHWQSMIREAARSGLSIREFCRRRQWSVRPRTVD
jgi:hypothetical protein